MHAAEADEVGAGGDRLDDVGAAAERAVDHDLGAAFRGLDDLRQRFYRAAAVVELPAAVVGNVDPLAAVIERDFASSAVAMPLRMSGILNFFLMRLTVRQSSSACSCGLRRAPPGGRVALGEVALAAAVMRGSTVSRTRRSRCRSRGARGVDRSRRRRARRAERCARIRARPPPPLRDPAHTPTSSIGRRRTRRRRSRSWRPAPVEDSSDADRREHAPASAACGRHRGRCVDFVHVAQHARREGHRVERQAVAPQRRLGLVPPTM